MSSAQVDTDLLVRKADMPSVTRVMRTLGYSRSNRTSGDLVMPQSQFVKDNRGGLVQVYDVHWKMALPILFADVLSFEEVLARAVDVPALGGRARALGRVDALLLACIHRVAHHRCDDRLLWLYDIHLLANDLANDKDQSGGSAVLRAGRQEEDPSRVLTGADTRTPVAPH